MAGFENDVLLCSNVNFNPSLPKPHLGLITVDGQLITGSTALNAGGTHLNIGRVVSPLGTLTIGYNSPNITLDVTGGTYISLSPFIVGTDTHSGYSTIASAIAAAVTAGATAANPQNVYIKPKADGTAYTENLTLSPGVNLVGFGGISTIIGKLSYSSAGIVNLNGIKLQTNSDFCLAITGSAASIVNLKDCFINCTNNTGISYTTANASSKLNIYHCEGDVGTTGITFIAKTATGGTTLLFSDISNSGASVTASTATNTGINFYNCFFGVPISYSGTASGGIFDTIFDNNTNNSTMITTAGTGNITVSQCYIASGSASAVSIGSGTIAGIFNCTINASNTNVLTGAGTLNYGLIVFSGSSSGHNVTTENPVAVLI